MARLSKNRTDRLTREINHLGNEPLGAKTICPVAEESADKLSSTVGESHTQDRADAQRHALNDPNQQQQPSTSCRLPKRILPN